MRILITNDDGISAPGLKVLHDIATDLAGPDGEVWTVAPAFEQSGVGHKISYTHPFMITKLDERRFAAEGAPADCVLAGLHEVLNGQTVDLILSGVNRGNNSAENALYSGTLGGAMEGALQGLPAFALSQYLGPDNFHIDNPFEAAAVHGAGVIRKVMDAAPKNTEDYKLFYNINFPPCPADAVKGTKVAAQGIRPHTSFHVEPHLSPSGKKFLWVRGTDQRQRSGDGTDAAVNLENYISVTPMRADLTAHDALEPLKAIE
ncbi:5'/3'-nucleotidase SurE [Pseudooceanicola onchidii]|uniref:5'/3'-nucleotidase SurE n=1 Tax=Pseudooceanicola onchidii TaxID=2562279 RepID=UPI0010AA1B84|nr:5'/3'-nucleotidase SurE [Pseudooceanicola onchidii]